MFLFRRRFLIAGAGVLAALVFCGHECASYFGTAAGWAKESVRSKIPMEFEIDRARKMVKDLVPDIRQNMHVIAREEVEVERLDNEIKTTEGRLSKDKDGIMRLKNDVASPRDSYEYGGRRYTVQQVKLDLANRFERYKTNDATLASLRDIHQARTKSLEAARQKLDGMLAAKRQLEVDVENLEARLKVVEVAQTTSSVNVDDSQLGRAKELVADLRSRLQVAEKLVNAEDRFKGEIPIDDAAAADIVDQVTGYFQNPTTTQPTVATAH
ncbi:MAG: hypothetical protein K8T25_07565 [Planctomycetia bacterium]|nr:hypothetical protein [Planctomycetia bacterium]